MMSQRARATVPLTLAIIVTLAAALVGAGAAYLIMDQRVDELERDLEQSTAQPSDDSQSDDEPDDLGSLMDEFGDLLDEDTLADSPSDELTQCLMPAMTDRGELPDGDLTTQVDAIEDQIGADRGFGNADYDIEFTTIEEVQERVVEMTEDELDVDEAADDARVLGALGAIDPSLDLAQAQLDALDEGVGGFYDPDTRELVIGSETMDGLGTLVTSHELVHAMADSTLGLPDTEEIADEIGADAAYAALSAIEGDASLYSQQFISQNLSLEDLLSLGMESLEAQGNSDLPHFVQRSLEFPYVEGLEFTCVMFLDQGWDGVDATYDKVPATTAQVLFPDRYQAGETAIDVRSPAGQDGWDLIESDQMGAADLLFMFEAPGDDVAQALSDPVDRVSAWAGGELHAWNVDGDIAVAMTLADRGEATPLCESLVEYYAAAFPSATATTSGAETTFDDSDQAAVIACDGDEAALGIGPDLVVAEAAIS
jgi:hypothetical protein